MTVVACLKLVDRRPQVDPLTGEVAVDVRMLGASDADLAALEWALRLGRAWGTDVLAVSAGPPAAEGMLRDALAAGATSVRRVDLPTSAPSGTVAAAIAAALPTSPRAVLCGDWSLDRGSGSVPAFLAARLDLAQALGAVSLEIDGDAVRVERRLDGGRRAVLVARRPVVISVEAASARLRRAALGAVLDAREAVVPSVAGPVLRWAKPNRVGPYRPRARVLASPSAALDPRERILALTGALSDRDPPQRLVLEPAEAADRLLDQLRRWGYLPPS